MDRFEIAWRIWCWKQGYVKAEDRVGLTNWMRDDQSVLHPNDITDRETLLEIADMAIEVAKEETDTVFCKSCRPILEGTEGGAKIIGYEVDFKIYDPEDVIIIREGERQFGRIR